MNAVMAVCAHEDGAGTLFEPGPAYDRLSEDDAKQQAAPSETIMSVIEGDLPEGTTDSETDGDDEPPHPPRGGGRPALRIVK